MQFLIKNVSDLQSISYSVKWQYFEKLVAFIFSENGFDARQNVVVKVSGSKRQFDVVARSSSKTFLVECKKWKCMKERASALRSSVPKHLERCSLYASMHEDENVVPVFVTLLDDDIALENGVPIVPIMKLNSFLQEFDRFEA